MSFKGTTDARNSTNTNTNSGVQGNGNTVYFGTIPHNNDKGMANYHWSYFGCPLTSMEHAT